MQNNEIEIILNKYNLQNNILARQVVEKNFLTKSQISVCKKNIISALQGDKVASQKPLSILVGGQSGAGKTALINYTQNMFSFREFVVIDNDLFRAFHPNVSEIRRLYPQFYTCATEQLSANILGDIISYFSGNNEANSKYNIILHQTLSKSEIVINYLTGFNNLGYTTGLNVLAVPYIESKMSQIERCTAQYNSLGFCRYVDSKHHLKSTSWLLETVDKIEKNSLTNFINVFSRSEDISKPNCVYTSVNNKEGVFINSNKPFQETIFDNKNGFSSAKEAIEKTREDKEEETLFTLDKRIDLVIENGGLQIPGMQPHIQEVQNYLTSFQNHPPSLCQEEEVEQ